MSAASAPAFPATLSAWSEPFLADQCNITASSARPYRTGLRRFLAWLHQSDASSPSRDTIIAYERAMQAQGLSANSAGTYLVVVRRFFEWLEGWKLYRNVARGVKGPQKPHGFCKDCLTRKQANELLGGIDQSTVEGLRDFALMNLMVRTGLRTLEVARADVGDIRQEGGEARLFVHGKGRDSKDEFVLLTGRTLKPIRMYLQARGVVSDSEPLFLSASNRNRRGRMTARSISRIVKGRLRAINLDTNRLTAHSLRHTAVTFAVRGGASIQDAQAMARHASINTTMVYFHNVNRFEQAGERKVDAWLDSPVGADLLSPGLDRT